MATTQCNPQERIARLLLTQSPGTFDGDDGDGCPHYWDSYEHAVAVVLRDGCVVEDVDKFEMVETPCQTLDVFCEHVRRQSGWTAGLRAGGPLVGDLFRELDQ